jgi:hypothetical protein
MFLVEMTVYLSQNSLIQFPNSQPLNSGLSGGGITQNFFEKNFDLCGYTSEHSTHEKEKNYHASSQGEKPQSTKD